MSLAALHEREKKILRLALSGESIIDWPRLLISKPEEAERLLKINEYNLQLPKDCDRLMAVHNEAIGYLKNQLQMDLPADLLRPDKIQNLFLIASDLTDRKIQSFACCLLKTMNIINHIDGRELLYNCPISMRDLYSLVEDKIERELSIARKELPGIKYEGGRKQKESLITKLIAKRETIAAQINDRVRYRIVTPHRADIVTIILKLFDTILPYNYVIPNASANQLMDTRELLGWKRSTSLAVSHLTRRLEGLVTDRLPYPKSEQEFTGSSYRVCKFVVDIPVKLDRFLGAAQRVFRTESLGNITYVLVEFQIVDEATDLRNNSGENTHARYKKRQQTGVAKRLIGK